MATAPVTFSDAPPGFVPDPPPAGAPAAPAASTAAPAGPVFSDAPPGFVADAPPSTTEDVTKGVSSGAAQFVTSLPAVPGATVQATKKPFDIAGNLLAKGVEWAHPGWGQYVPSQENIEKYYAEHPEIPAPAEFRGQPSTLLKGGLAAKEAAAGAVDPVLEKAGLGPTTYQPTTTEGEIGQVVGGFLPSALLMQPELAAGQGLLRAGVGTAGRLVTQAAVPGAEAWGGGKIAQALGYDPMWGQMLGPSLAGVATGGVKAAGKAAFGAAFGDPSKMTPELQEAVANAATQYPGAKQPYMPIGAATDQGTVRKVASPLAGELPGANIWQSSQAQKSIDSIGDYATGLNRAAGASNPTSAGEVLINKMKGWFTGGSRKSVEDAYNAVGADPTIRQAPSNVATTLQNIRAQRANAGMDLNTGLDTADAALAQPNGLDYAGTKLQRTALRTNTPAGLLPGEYDQLYDAWTKDLDSVAAANGPQVAAQHQVANDLTISVARRREAMGQMLGMSDKPGASPSVSPEAMFGRIQSYAQEGPGANIAKLQQIKGTLGAQDWQEIAGTVGQQLGLDANGKFDMPTFFRNYNGLSDAGKDAIFGAKGSSGYRNAYDTLSALSSRGTVLQKMAGPSWQHPVLGAAEALGGLWFEPMITLAGLGGGGVLSGLLSRPATAASVARWAKTGQGLSLAQRAGRATPQMVRNFAVATRNLHNTAAAAGVPLPANLGAQGQSQ